MGLNSRADVRHPDGPVRGAAVVLHPHPDHGGDRFNSVSTALWEALATAGYVTVRFDFSSSDLDTATDEAVQAAALAIDAALAAGLPTVSEPSEPNGGNAATGEGGTVRGPIPVVVAGYSFGALVALRVPAVIAATGQAPGDEGGHSGRLVARVLVAPPLGAGVGRPTDPPREPTLLLSPAHDQIAPAAAVGQAVEAWPTTTFEVVEGADHFLVGRANAVAARATAWLTDHT